MDCQNNLMSDRLLKESNVIAALRGLLESPAMQELGTGSSFLPEVAAAVHNVPEEDVVPKDYHERCMELVTQRIKAEKKQKMTEETNRQIIENYAPVLHGRWEEGGYACGETEWKCSVCGETEWRTSCNRMKFCMFCGAKMDGGSEV